MQVAGKAGPFRYPLIEPRIHLGRDPTKPEPVCAGEEQGRTARPRQDGKVRFVKIRILSDVIDDAGLIPYSVAIACSHMECMSAKGNAAIYGGDGSNPRPAIRGLRHPAGIAFESLPAMPIRW